MKHTTTLLCDVINEEMIGLDTILRTRVEPASEGVDDTILRVIEDQFIVQNWDEFLTKFQPALYEVSVVDANTGLPTIQYTTKKPDFDVPKIEFKRDHPLMKSFLQLMERHAMDGRVNAYFEFSEALKDSFSPEKLKKEAEQLKKDMLYLSEQYEQLDDVDPQKDLVGDKLAENIQKASAFFKNNTSLLQLAQATVGQQLLALATQNEEAADEPLLLNYASFELTEEGIKTVAIPVEQQVSTNAQPNAGQQQLIGYIGGYYDQVVEQEVADDSNVIVQHQDSYQKQLVVSALTGSMLVNIENVPQTVNQYNQYVDVTADIMSNYFTAVSELFGKVIGVKQFFDEYETHTKSKKVAPRLLVANAKLEDLVSLDQFKLYLNTIHDEGLFFEQSLTAAIVPGVALKEVEAKSATPEFTLPGQKKKPRKEQKIDGVQVSDVKTLAKLLNVYKVPVFFGFKGESATFTSLQGVAFKQEIEPFLLKMKEQKAEWNESLVPCYPNFTIIPNKTNLTTAVRVEVENDQVKKGQESKIQVAGFYLDASYVAASLVVSQYCPSYLKGKYPEQSEKITDALPGVRISLSEQATKTTLPIEVKSMPSTLLERINEVAIGFVFVSQNSPVSNGKIMVYNSSTSRVNADGKARPLHRLLVERYIYYTIRDKYSPKSTQAFENILNQKKPDTLGFKLKELKSKFNRIFHEDETVTFEEGGFLNFKFNEEENPIKVIIKSDN